MDICGCDDYYKDVWHFGEKGGNSILQIQPTVISSKLKSL